MFARFLLMFAVLVTVSACSSTEDELLLEDQVTEQREEITDSPLSEIYQDDLQGPESGTQADLVTNVGDRVFFGYDQDTLTQEARTTLDQQAQWLQQYPDISVTIEGHADERGTREYNLALAERRANAAQNYLIALGIDPRRIETISYGKERPAVPGSNPTAWSQNRRAVTKVN